MFTTTCARCSLPTHPLARIGGKAHCLDHFEAEHLEQTLSAVARIFSSRIPPRNPDHQEIYSLCQALRRSQYLAEALSAHSAHDGRRQLAEDVAESVGMYLPCALREYYTVAQGELPPELRLPPVCRWCGAAAPTADLPDGWLYWDLCSDELCYARDAGCDITNEDGQIV